MEKLLLFGFLTWITGNPLLALLAVLLLSGLGYGYVSGSLFRVPRVIERWTTIRQLERAVATNPHDAVARADLGRLLVEAGRPARALPHLEAAAERAPEVAETAYYLGAACLGVDNLARGSRLIGRALARDPKLRYGEPHLALADYFLAHRRPAEALPHLERFTAIHASSVEGRYKLARAALAAGEPERARAALDEVVHLYRAAPSFKRREERFWRLKAAWLRRRVPAR